VTEQKLKTAFAASIVLCVALAAALAYILVHRAIPVREVQANADPVVARGPASASPNAIAANPPATSPGEPALAPIELSPQRMQEIGVTTALVETKEVGDELRAPGTVAIDEQRLSYVQTRFPGWIRNVFANATYQYVRKGQKLFTIYSPDLVSTEQEYLLAKQNQRAVSEHMHGTAEDEGNWLLEAAEERLNRYDIPNAELAQLEKTGSANHEIAIDSPASGYIIERNALPNAYIQPETKLYTIADLSTVWVYANVPQIDVGRLKPGDPAQVSVDAYPERNFNGHIDQILPDVDAATRTVRVRLVMSNPGIALKPGMYVSVDIRAPLGRQLVIPASGVLEAGTRQIAYIDHGQSLEPREIKTGPRLNDSIVVLKGLKAGDRIVSSANFLVDSEAQLQSTGGGPPSPQPQSARVEQPATEQLQISVTTAPDPPRKGSNAVRVKLTDADGNPVTGARVSVAFFMPAMPAMGMPAMHSSVGLAEGAGGSYTAPVQLGSGGSWQVTVTVQRGGRILATKQLGMSATGGM
jgi:RND family efflux transporter MFP subunit